ncbi:hypothetical protein [uncultured Psychrobacter sp.]
MHDRIVYSLDKTGSDGAANWTTKRLLP